MEDWIYNGKSIKSIEDIPEGAFGFIYNIVTEPCNGVKPMCQEYIGKKQIGSVTYPQISKRQYDIIKKEGGEVKKTKDKTKSKKGAVVWRYKKKVIKESDWKSYVGSSALLKEDISKGVKITRYILHFAYSKQELSYLEERELFCTQVLEHGDKFYNGAIRNSYHKKLFEKKLQGSKK